jgi:hypothetical protein
MVPRLLVRALERFVTALLPLMPGARQLPVMRSGRRPALVELLPTCCAMRLGTMRVLPSIALSAMPRIRLMLLMTARVSRAITMTAIVRFGVSGSRRTAM